MTEAQREQDTNSPDFIDLGTIETFAAPGANRSGIGVRGDQARIDRLRASPDGKASFTFVMDGARHYGHILFVPAGLTALSEKDRP